MSLVRPEQHLEVAPVQETALQQQILGELGHLNRQVTKIDHNQQLMSVALLGSVDGDTKHGRLPIVEMRVDNHAVRLDSLEADRIRWTAAAKASAKAAAWIGGVVGSVSGAVVMFVLRLIFKI